MALVRRDSFIAVHPLNLAREINKSSACQMHMVSTARDRQLLESTPLSVPVRAYNQLIYIWKIYIWKSIFGINIGAISTKRTRDNPPGLAPNGGRA